MKNIYLIAMLVVVVLQSCSTTKTPAAETSVLWVGGYKTEAAGGAGKMQVLNVHRGDDLDNPEWENFYAKINGFEFEEGYLQKIEVKEEKLDKEQVPADGSSIKYTLVKVLDKQADIRTKLNGDFILARLNGGPLNKMVVAPKLSFDLAKKTVSGNAGCNNFSGSIKSVAASQIELGQIASTQRACINKNVETEFNQALGSVRTYQIKGPNLVFFDEGGKEVLAFMQAPGEAAANSRLHDIWAAAKIDGHPINRKDPIPRMELNLTEMQVMGSDGCNNYTGKIKNADDGKLAFGPLAATKKLCRNMETAKQFNQAMNKVAAYKLDGLNLTLLDADGKEVLQFLKVD